MAVLLNPYLNFLGTAREAMTFYHEVLGGELRISTFGDYGASDETHPEDGVMHARIEAPGGVNLMASDTTDEHEAQTNGRVGLTGDDEVALTKAFEQLSEGGTVIVPISKQAWGDTFGMVVDRFGITWLVNISST